MGCRLPASRSFREATRDDVQCLPPSLLPDASASLLQSCARQALCCPRQSHLSSRFSFRGWRWGSSLGMRGESKSGKGITGAAQDLKEERRAGGSPGLSASRLGCLESRHVTSALGDPVRRRSFGPIPRPPPSGLGSGAQNCQGWGGDKGGGMSLPRTQLVSSPGRLPDLLPACFEVEAVIGKATWLQWKVGDLAPGAGSSGQGKAGSCPHPASTLSSPGATCTEWGSLGLRGQPVSPLQIPKPHFCGDTAAAPGGGPSPVVS